MLSFAMLKWSGNFQSLAKITRPTYRVWALLSSVRAVLPMKIVRPASYIVNRYRHRSRWPVRAEK